jgi:TRAP-type C4-dicarboxylate transport system permease small subunit
VHRLLSELCLVPLVELSETIFLVSLPLHFILLFLKFLVQLLDNLAELLDLLGIFVTTSGLSIFLVS